MWSMTRLCSGSITCGPLIFDSSLSWKEMYDSLPDYLRPHEKFAIIGVVEAIKKMARFGFFGR